ncbi:MAG: hypothetical protein FWD26_06080 [Treponema sp.]|nr:hypothetical protein [Treponema sp.]
MPAHIPLKQTILMLLGGLVCSIGVVFLLNYLLSGPKFGLHYDFLLENQKPPVVSHEILIIETDEFVDGSDIFTVFMTLTEMDAANLVMTGKVSPSSSPIMLTEAEIRRRFLDEYSLVGYNIRNLFEGIRRGSVSPLDAPVYVEQVVELTEKGRDRLLSALVDRDEDLIRSVLVFGNYLEAPAEPLLDRDGKIRRVKLLDTDFEHPVFFNLKNRYDASQIEITEHGKVLWLRASDSSSIKEFDIPLDKDGNVITPWNSAFRRIDISLFREYEESGYAMRDALIAADELGVFSILQTELSPLLLDDYSFVLREELLQNPGSENRIAWRIARSNYFKSLDDLLNTGNITAFINDYEVLIADTDSSNEEKLKELISVRDIITAMHDEYKKLSAIHNVLKNELFFSYCVMGPPNNALYSALAANVMITGSHIKLIADRHMLFWSVLSSLIVLLAVFLLRPFLLLFTGVVLSLLFSVIFGLIFFFNLFWMDPVIVLGSSLAGTLVIFYCKCALLKHRVRVFTAAYGAVVSKSFLQNLISFGRPHLSEINVTNAVIIAIKDINLLSAAVREKSQDAGKVRNTFYSSVKKVAFNAGAVIVGFEGDTILVCFGSPLELQKWSSHVKSYNPIDKAYSLVCGLLEINENTWRFGIDAGECTFYWSPETGYSVNGRPAIRARLLVSKAIRLKIRAIVTDTIRKKIDMNGEMLSALAGEDALYQITNNKTLSVI